MNKQILYWSSIEIRFNLDYQKPTNSKASLSRTERKGLLAIQKAEKQITQF